MIRTAEVREVTSTEHSQVRKVIGVATSAHTGSYSYMYILECRLLYSNINMVGGDGDVKRW